MKKVFFKLEASDERAFDSGVELSLKPVRGSQHLAKLLALLPIETEGEIAEALWGFAHELAEGEGGTYRFLIGFGIV